MNHAGKPSSRAVKKIIRPSTPRSNLPSNRFLFRYQNPNFVVPNIPCFAVPFSFPGSFVAQGIQVELLFALLIFYTFSLLLALFEFRVFDKHTVACEGIQVP